MINDPSASGASESVDPDIYTDVYYLTNCHGHEEFVASGGDDVNPRFMKALALAGPMAGRRILDVGCGRGEVVIQAARQGAEAWGIDYADVAIMIARKALASADDEVRERTHVERMDVKSMEFREGFFDVAFMLDVVEHLYPNELGEAFDDVYRVLRPGGRLIVHTSPNTIFSEVVYRHYSRRWNQAALALSRLFRYRDAFFNEKMLPTAREFPQNPFEREMHVNEQSAPRLRRQLKRHGFRVRRVEFWTPPVTQGFFLQRPMNLRLLDFMRFLKPLSNHPPLDRYFCNHIWMIAERP